MKNVKSHFRCTCIFKKHQVYYKTDEFYRILSYQKVITADKEQYLYYIKNLSNLPFYRRYSIHRNY